MRQVSDALGLTERRVASIVKGLAAVGMVQVARRGRRNTYAVEPTARLRHPTLSYVPLGRIVAAVGVSPAGERDGATTAG